MSEESSHAWVLHKQWSGDTSARVIFFTRDKGIVQALCQGGRAPKKQALLQAFIPLWVSFNVRSNWHYVNKLEMLSSALNLTNQSLFAGLYVNELLYLTLRPLDAHQELYDAYEATIHELNKPLINSSLEIILRRFEWTLLQSIGYGISLTHESSTGLPILSTNQYKFIPEEGLIQTQQGIIGSHILALADDKLDDRDVRKVAKYIMRVVIDHAVGNREIKSRCLIRQRP